jgi:ribose transport system ATP-binding protein
MIQSGGEPLAGMHNQVPLVAVRGITKEYPGVRALQNVALAVRRGEIRALVGENGAGKSTLIRILTGAEPPTAGEIFVEGRRVAHMTPALSERLGIACVYQNLMLAEHLTVAENIWMGRLPARLGIVDTRELHAKTERILSQIGYRDVIHPGDRVKDLSAPQQGMVAIARAISREARVAIFDEPTAVLAEREVNELFRVIRRLRQNGLAIIYISHRMDEIFELCDTVTVLKDGWNAGEAGIQETTAERLIALMVGRVVSGGTYDHARTIGEVLLRAEGLWNPNLYDCSLTVRAGEIVGLYGLVGAGRTELSRALFGCDRITAGSITVAGAAAPLKNPRQAIDRGLGLVPEDRRRQGLALQLSVKHNLNLAVYRFNQIAGLIRTRVESGVARTFIERLDIKTTSPDQRVKNLSGGNQQKVVLGKWLAGKARVFILDEPTNGIDVGAKDEIYRLINTLARGGAAILFISSYMPELMGICDRILVMNRGRIVRDVPRSEFEEHALLGYALQAGQ